MIEEERYSERRRDTMKEGEERNTVREEERYNERRREIQ